MEVLTPLARKSENFIDVSLGTLYVGRSALQATLEQEPDLQGQIHPLAEALVDEGIEIQDQTPLDVTDWSRADHITNITWLHNEVRSIGATFSTKVVMQRAYRLGISPSVRRLDRIGKNPFSRLYQEAGLEGYKRGLYDNWSVDQFVTYISSIALGMPKNQSLQAALAERARLGKGPSRKVVARRFGSMGNLLDLAGLFCKGGSTNPDGCIDWGVNFMLANNGLVPNGQHLYYFSPKRLSPSRRTIYDIFDSMPLFQTQVTEHYEAEVKYQRERVDEMLWQIKDGQEQGTLPDSLSLDDEEQTVSRYAKWLVAKKLLDVATNDRLNNAISASNGEFFVRALRRYQPTLSVAEIEVAAVHLDVFDEIWPMTQQRDRLILPIAS